ncbi:hypothetical protein [Litchfieldia alkalitelluris]|uniref:hypothetical protein n=1 Tax=Litchfieldia alkalitelluris TaxID=304268 RepID=UPI0009965D63|nr:hypothetical protein [Litchfieldia alkalitelluris]
MKKSIRGNIKTKLQSDKDLIVSDINKYTLWKLDTQNIVDIETGEESFAFEAWLNDSKDEFGLWADMKKHVDKHKLKSKIDKHDCTHDEQHKKPCVIAETYEVM